MSYRLAIFDFDGTLVSSLDAICECMTRALSAFNFRAPSRDEVRATVGLTLEESIRILTRNKVSPAVLPEIVERYRELHNGKLIASISLFEGAGKLLEELPSYKIKSVLVSNKGRKALNQILERLKIWAFFDLTLNAEDVPCNKPDPNLFTQYIAPHFTDIPLKQILVIGDTDVDIRFAKAAGLRSCWVRYGYGDASKCHKLGPDHEAKDVKELRGVLRGG